TAVPLPGVRDRTRASGESTRVELALEGDPSLRVAELEGGARAVGRIRGLRRDRRSRRRRRVDRPCVGDDVALIQEDVDGLYTERVRPLTEPRVCGRARAGSERAGVELALERRERVGVGERERRDAGRTR